MAGSDMDDEPEWMRGALERLDVLYAEDPRLHMGSKMAPAWQFLYGRFNTMQQCLRIADEERLDTHATRLGREIDDRWIEVDYARPLVSDYTPFPDSDDDDQPRSQASRYQVIRESLVLMSALARADYTTWIEELGRACQFRAPKHINLDVAPLERKFLFTFDAPRDVSELEWEKLQHLFGNQGYDEDFRSEFADAVRVAETQGVDVGKMDPILIQLRYIANPQWTEAEQIQVLRHIGDTIQHMQHIEDSYRRAQHDCHDGTPPVPVFTVDSIILEMDNLKFSPQVLQEVEHVIELGIPIKSLSLPVFPLPQEPDWLLCLSAWGPLVSTICGHPQRAVRSAVVHSVSISAISASSPFLVSFLAALRQSRAPTSLMIAAGREFEAESFLWSWLAFSVFRADSTCSVEVLHLDNFELTRDFNQFPIVLASDDPLGCMWGMLLGSESESHGYRIGGNPRVVVRGGAKVNIQQARGQPGIVVRVPCDWRGQLVIADPTMPTVCVFLPGFGLGTIHRECLTTAIDSQCEPSSLDPIDIAGRQLARHQLRTLVLDAHAIATQQDVQDEDCLLQFFQLIGHRLTGLDLSADFLDDGTLAAVLWSCPKLESVRLSRVTLESMDFLSQSYATGNCHISSLEFRYLSIEHLVLESFLRLLAALGSAVHRTLKKLRLDEMWITSLPISMLHVLTQIIEDPTSLSHLHLYMNSFDEVRALTTERLAGFHGQVVAPAPVPVVNRLALISALRLQDEHSAVMQLDQDMLRLVYALAGDPQRRVVLVDCHTD